MSGGMTSGLYAPAGPGWRLAGSLIVLAHELDAAYGDTLTCLGTVGDAAHAAENMASDHNPFIRDPREPSIGIVRAIDIGGPDILLRSIRVDIWNLYADLDPRLYEFGYAKGCSDNLINNWGVPFRTHVDTGDAGHLHVSVTQADGNHPSAAGYDPAIDSGNSWGFLTTPVPSNDGATQLTENEDDMADGPPYYAHTVDPDGNPKTYVIRNDFSGKLHLVTPTADMDIQKLTAALPTYNTTPAGATGPGRGLITVSLSWDLVNSIPDYK